MPYPFYTPKQIAWREFAEDAESGASTKLMKNVRNLRFVNFSVNFYVIWGMFWNYKISIEKNFTISAGSKI